MVHNDGSNIEVPSPQDKTSCDGYTGFNSLDLQQIYRVEKMPAFRSQIARGYGKPIVVRLPGGDLLATGYYNHRDDKDYVYPDGRRAHSGKQWWMLDEAALFRSSDEGKTWSPPQLLGFPGAPTQFSCLRNGTLIMALVWGTLLCSTDGGETWIESVVAWDTFASEKQNMRIFGETNGTVELPDGTLLCSCSAHRYPQQTVNDWHSYLIRSTDRGKTWGDATFVVHTDEVNYVRLPEGKLLGFARLCTMYIRDVLGIKQIGEGGDTVAIMESNDNGRTWTEPHRFGLGMAQVPAFPLYLPDGRLLLIYGNRQFPFGSQVIASRDMGQTWNMNNPIILSWFSWDNYGGHPRSILMPDGSIITGYYVRMFKESTDVNKDIVSHIVRWCVPDDWPPNTKKEEH